MTLKQIQELNELGHYCKDHTTRWTPFQLGNMSITELRKIKKMLQNEKSVV